MNLLFWIEGLGCGGKERQLSELVSGLVRTGRVQKENLAVISMEHGGHFDEVIQEAGVRIVRLLRKCQWDPLLPVRARRVAGGCQQFPQHRKGAQEVWLRYLRGKTRRHRAGAQGGAGEVPRLPERGS